MTQVDMMDAGVMDRPPQPVTPPRPTRTPAMTLQAAKNLVKSEMLDIKELEAAAADIAKHHWSCSDGYELAKTLESYCGWAIDVGMIEALDGMSRYVDQLLREAQRQWVKAFDIQPPLPIGSPVSFNLHSGHKTGIAESVCEHSPACYQVKQDGQTGSSRWIIKYEDVTLLEPVQ